MSSRRIVQVAWSVALLVAGLALWGVFDVSTDQVRATSILRTPGSVHDSFPGQRWGLARPPASSAKLTAEQTALSAIGYTSGLRPVGGAVGVTVFEPALADDGLNLFNFGHEAAAVLMDMQGEVVHRWALDIEPELEPGESLNLKAWRRVRVLDDGGLLAIHDGQYLLRMDNDSQLMWIHRGNAHHDLDVLPDGSIVVLTRESHIVPRIHPTRPCLEDFIIRLDGYGRQLSRFSVLEAIQNSPYAALLNRMPAHGDILHTNTLERLDGRWVDQSPAFRAGNLLVSIRELDTVAVIDPEQRAVVWALTGLWNAQHQPTFLDNGRMLVFDNMFDARIGEGGALGASRVIEIDPLTQQVAWTYTGTPESPFFSAECGSSQRLPNGNTLITETDTGRAFEVTSAGRIVWEFRSPYRSGDHGQFVASLFEVVRLPKDFGAAWRADR